MRKTLSLACLVLLCAWLAATASAWAGTDGSSFREQNDLVVYTPPEWFLAGCFVAREVRPLYLFGSVADFVASLPQPCSWLIEAAEQERQARLAKEGKSFEYTIYLEFPGSGGPRYWVFVVLPHKNAQEWYQERWSYHKSKTKDYYGQTQSGLERAMADGLNISGELRFLVERGQVSLEVPEDVLRQTQKFPAIYDLREGKRL